MRRGDVQNRMGGYAKGKKKTWKPGGSVHRQRRGDDFTTQLSFRVSSVGRCADHRLRSGYLAATSRIIVGNSGVSRHSQYPILLSSHAIQNIPHPGFPPSGLSLKVIDCNVRVDPDEGLVIHAADKGRNQTLYPREAIRLYTSSSLHGKL